MYIRVAIFWKSQEDFMKSLGIRKCWNLCIKTQGTLFYYIGINTVRNMWSFL